tara:strand:+ start:15464 stop:15694 length:231 start_codon:yes stop_codon:yes gene_type:complete
MNYIILLFFIFLVGCSGHHTEQIRNIDGQITISIDTSGQLKINDTFVMPKVETSPEERYVADQHPVEPVIVKELND